MTSLNTSRNPDTTHDTLSSGKKGYVKKGLDSETTTTQKERIAGILEL